MCRVMERILVLTCLLSSAFAVYYGVRPKIYSRRGDDSANNAAGAVQNGNASDVETVLNLVRDTLQNATKGIDTKDLVVAASRIRRAAKAFVRATGMKVSAKEVRAFIDEAAAKFNITTVASSLFDDPLELEATHLAEALLLLNSLVEKAEELKASGVCPAGPVTGIRWLAGIIRRLAFNTESIITYTQQYSVESGQRRR